MVNGITFQGNVYQVLPNKENIVEARNNAFNQGQLMQYEIGKDIASDFQTIQQEEEYKKKCSIVTGIGGGATAAIGVTTAFLLSGPIGWTIAACGGTVALAGSILSCVFNSNAQEAKQDKNSAIQYANNAAPNDGSIAFDEDVIPKNLDGELISDRINSFIEDGTLSGNNYTYLSVTDSTGDGSDVDYGKFSINLNQFDSKNDFNNIGGYNGFSETVISIPKEFKDFAQMLLDGNLNDTTVGNIDEIMLNINSGNLSYIDVNNDGYINDYDQNAMAHILDGLSLDSIQAKLSEKLTTAEQISYDVNGDGYFDEEDAKAYEALLNNTLKYADINKDGAVDETDKVLLNEYVSSIANHYFRLHQEIGNVEKQVGIGTLNGKTLDEIANQ